MTSDQLYSRLVDLVDTNVSDSVWHNARLRITSYASNVHLHRDIPQISLVKQREVVGQIADIVYNKLRRYEFKRAA